VAVNSDASVKRLKEPGRPSIPRTTAPWSGRASAVDAVVIFGEDHSACVESRSESGRSPSKAPITASTTSLARRHVMSYGGKVLTCELVPGKSTTRVVNVLRGKGEQFLNNQRSYAYYGGRAEADK